MYKRLLSSCLALVLILFIAPIPVAQAASAEAVSAANALYELGLFSGSGKDSNGNPNFDLDRTPTRHEAVTMLVRLLGKATEAEKGSWTTPFTDVANWATPYVGYAYTNNLTSGTSATTYSGNDVVTTSQYITFVLRSLGYESGADFQWDKAWELSDKIGLTNGQYNASTTNFTRGDVVIISYCALNCNLKNTNQTLANKLINEGAFSKELYESIPNNTTGIALNHQYAYIAKGETLKLEVESIPKGPIPSVSWKSDDSEYIQVNNGIVTVVKDGGAASMITATSESGLSATCYVMMKSSDITTQKSGDKIVYTKFPSILSFENISPDTPLWTHHDISYPEFDIYDYSYSYLVSDLTKAEELAKTYAYWLKQQGYTLIREEDDPIVKQSVGNDIIYRLRDPSDTYTISIKGTYPAIGGTRITPEVSVSIDYSSKDTSTTIPSNPQNTVQIKELVLTDKTLNITPGEVITVGATCIPMYAYPNLTWTSSNPAVATVQYLETIKSENVYNGTTYDDSYVVKAAVTAISAGNTVITVTAQNGVTARINVTVSGDNIEKAQAAVDALRSILKFPASLSLNSVRIYQGHSTEVVEIDYSAMNGFGGYNRGYFSYTGSTSGTIEYSVIDRYNYPYVSVDLSKLH